MWFPYRFMGNIFVLFKDLKIILCFSNCLTNITFPKQFLNWIHSVCGNYLDELNIFLAYRELQNAVIGMHLARSKLLSYIFLLIVTFFFFDKISLFLVTFFLYLDEVYVLDCIDCKKNFIR